MNSLTKEQKKLYQNANICYVYKEMFEDKNAEDKKYRIVRDNCHNTREYRGAADNIYNLKYSIPKEISKVSHNGSNYGYHFIIKVLAKEFEKEFICFRGNTDKCITFSFRIPELKKMEKKLQKRNLTDYNLLITKDSWQDDYQNLFIIFLKEFTKLNGNVNTMIRFVKLAELNTKVATAFLNTQTLKMI